MFNEKKFQRPAKKFTLFILFVFSVSLYGQRIKDISYLSGENSQQIIGYGLIVGLAGTGDTYRTKFTVQSVTSMLKRFGITVPQTDLRTRNVAAVMVTATLNPYLKPGAKFDVNVSSMGDASSLLGGVLLMTPLSGMNGQVYAFAQGPISIGGYDFRTPTGGRVAKNHALAGRVPDGGVLQKPLGTNILGGQELSIYLHEPDMTTAFNISNAINSQFGEKTAIAVDASEVKVKIPSDKKDNIVGFMSELESINVQTDNTAKVVLNERTGTIVAGENVMIKPCTISYGSLSIVIRSYPIISQPGAFSNGTTAIFNNQVPTTTVDSTKTVAITGATNVQEVATALNSLKVSPKDIISIFQAIKEAGALVGELVIL